PNPEYVPVVLENFERYSKHGKGHAQRLLLNLNSREGDRAFIQLVRDHGRAGRIPYLVLAPIEREPRNADIFFPFLLEYASVENFSHDIYRICLSYCEARMLSREQLAPLSEQLLTAYRDLAKTLRPAQRADGLAWMWEDDYSIKRSDAGLYLDLLGFFPGEVVKSDLQSALEYHDPHLKCFAIISLLRLGKDVSSKDVADVAASAEMRNVLYDALQKYKKTELFPPKYRNQAAFAESDMVNWLIYPTELARVPDEIELMKVVPIDTGFEGGIYDYYLFRFRTKEPHWAAKDGWIAGVSGPFARNDAPTTKALGHTFSEFAKWDSKKPEEHVGDTQELLQQWREYHCKRSK